MLRLLKIEIHKIFYSKIFWVLLGLYGLLMVPLSLGMNKLPNLIFNFIQGANPLAGTPMEGFSIFNHPNVWHFITFLSTWFNTLLVIILIIVVTNDFRFKTLKQHIIDGMSKWEVILAKQLVIVLLIGIGALFNIILVLALGKNVEGVSMFEGIPILLPYCLAMFLYMNLAYFLSFCFRRSGIALIFLLLYSWVVENVASFTFLPESVSKILPMKLVKNMIPNPGNSFLGLPTESDLSFFNISVCAAYITFFIGFNYWMLKRGIAAKS